jgi:hypothetical protein
MGWKVRRAATGTAAHELNFLLDSGKKFRHNAQHE